MYLKRASDPYLHELFKAVLLYEAERIKVVLAQKLEGKLLREWTLVRSFQELLGFNRWRKEAVQADVVWMLNHPVRADLGYRAIIHEVKTGQFSCYKEFERYQGVGFKFFFEQGERRIKTNLRCCSTNIPLYIWDWKKYLEAVNDLDFRKGAYQSLPLEWILPILEEKVRGMVEE